MKAAGGQQQRHRPASGGRVGVGASAHTGAAAVGDRGRATAASVPAMNLIRGGRVTGATHFNESKIR